MAVSAGACPDLVRLNVVGAGLGIALHQRGKLVLHGSTVVVGEAAVTFLGEEGDGKSTITAALYALECRVVADDIAAIDTSGVELTIAPGFPEIKIWAEAAKALGFDPSSLSRLRPGYDKLALPVPVGFSHDPVRLGTIFILGRGETLEVEPLAPQDAVIELVRHTYCRRLLPASGDKTHLAQCARVAGKVGVYRLRIPRRLEAVKDAARLAIAYVSGRSPATTS